MANEDYGGYDAPVAFSDVLLKQFAWRVLDNMRLEMALSSFHNYLVYHGGDLTLDWYKVFQNIRANFIKHYGNLVYPVTNLEKTNVHRRLNRILIDLHNYVKEVWELLNERHEQSKCLSNTIADADDTLLASIRHLAGEKVDLQNALLGKIGAMTANCHQVMTDLSNLRTTPQKRTNKMPSSLEEAELTIQQAAAQLAAQQQAAAQLAA